MTGRFGSRCQSCGADFAGRPGRGGSEAVSTPQDASQVATDLHTLLQRGNVPGPYVLAGHSFGGLYVLTYAARYPDQVAGMVVVDTTAPRETPPDPGSDEPNGYYPLGRVATLISTSARLGLTRLYAPTEAGALPPQSEDEARANLTTGSNLRSFVDEFAQANSLRGRSRSVHRLRRQAAGGADRRHRKRRRPDRQPRPAHRHVDQQRPPSHRRRDPSRAHRRREGLGRDQSGDPRRGRSIRNTTQLTK